MHSRINIETVWIIVVRITIKVILENRKKREGRERKNEKRGTYILITTVVVAWIRIGRKVRKKRRER